MNDPSIFSIIAPALIFLESWLIAYIANCLVEGLMRVIEARHAQLFAVTVIALSVMFGGGWLVLWTIVICYE